MFMLVFPKVFHKFFKSFLEHIQSLFLENTKVFWSILNLYFGIV